MYILVPIPCTTCKTVFMPKSEKNKYCTRKCFKKDNYHKKKAEELTRIRFPSFLCPSCEQRITLDFDPVIESLRWLHYECPGCDALMLDVSDEIVPSLPPTEPEILLLLPTESPEPSSFFRVG
jgi:hypothetical protein